MTATANPWGDSALCHAQHQLNKPCVYTSPPHPAHTPTPACAPTPAVQRVHHNDSFGTLACDICTLATPRPNPPSPPTRPGAHLHTCFPAHTP
eukprot:352594-Chlamydomonas_euryale.AAC.2